MCQNLLEKDTFPTCILDLQVLIICLLNGKVNTFIVERHVYFEYILHVIKVMAKFWLICQTDEVQKDKEGHC